MFTGLVQKKGVFVKLSGGGGATVMEIACSPWDGDPLVKGESVAVQGACLTVVGISERGFTADVLAETLACTTIKNLKKGDPLNLERALRLSDRLGGHIVSGHVDGTGVIKSISKVGRDYCLRLVCCEAEARYIVWKGSVALDGISLTVSAVPSLLEFEVCIIPTTWQETSLGSRSVGDEVNIETDIIGRYVEKLGQGVGASAPKTLSMEKLMESGF